MTARLTLLLSCAADEREEWSAAIAQALAAEGVAARLLDDPAAADPAVVDAVIFAPDGPVRDFAPFTRLQAIISLWAGVERIVADPAIPAHVPLARMVEPGLTWGMRDYVVGHVMRLHLGLDATLRGPGPDWGRPVPPLARDRRVGVLGLGELGGVCAAALAGLGFDVAGWSRGPKALSGVDCHSGEDGLDAVLARSEILVCLLPSTPATRGLLDARRLALAPRGAGLINAGRGDLIDDAALLAALDAGALSSATLDVFREEPLPADHPFRRHPRVTVTPHVASATRPGTAAQAVAAQAARLSRGQPLANVVDRAAGY